MNEFDKVDIYSSPGVTFGHDLIFASLKRLIDQQHLEQIFASATVGVDLGSAYGESALALMFVSPNLQQLHTVDVDTTLSDEVRQLIGSRLRENIGITIKDFLESSVNSGLKVDVVMAASILTHYLSSAEDYNLLGELVRTGGLFIEISESNFDHNRLAKYFYLKCQNNGGRIMIWQKK